MSVIIKPVKNVKKISKHVIKEIRKFIKEKPRLRIGIDWNSTTQSVLDIVKKNKKIDWYNSKIFSLSEYRVKQTHPLESELYRNFVENINIYKNNFESMVERISKLDSANKIKHLYNFEGGVDLMIFSIDSRGNFVFNDYESGLCLINSANNGSDIYSPGIASILMAKKIICFIAEEAAEKVLKTLNDKKIEKNDALTYLQLHLDCTIYTLTSLISKKDVNKTISPQNYSEFRKEIANIQNELNDDVENQNVNTQQEDANEEEKPLDGSIPESLDGNNYNKSNLDKELQETLEADSEDDEDQDLDQNLFSDDDSQLPQEENEDELEEEPKELEEPEENTEEEQYFEEPNEKENKELEETIEEPEETTEEETRELSEEETEKLVSDFEKTLDENGHVTDYKINDDEEIYVVENLDDEDKQPDDSDEEIMSVDDLINDDGISESIELDSSIEVDEPIEDDDFKKLDLEDTEPENVEDLEPLDPEDLDKELLNLDSNLDNVVENHIETQEEPKELEESIDDILVDPNLELDDSNKDIPDNFRFKNEIPDGFEENTKSNQLQPEEQPQVFTGKPKSDYEKLLKVIEIKTDTLSSIEWLLLENRLGKLRNKLFTDNYLENKQAEEEKFIKNLNSYVKLVYVPGSRPTPLLRLDNTPNEFEYVKIYAEMVKNLKLNIPKKRFTFNDSHIWNVGAYFSYNKKTNEIDLLAFSDFYKFIYLLRHLNRPLYFYLKKEDYLILKNDLKDLNDEFKIFG